MPRRARRDRAAGEPLVSSAPLRIVGAAARGATASRALSVDPSGAAVSRSVEDRRAALARGEAAEAHVADHLLQAGWEILARRWTGGGGELDLVVRRDGVVRFVEVRARADGLIPAEETIGHGKRSRLRRAARSWMQQHPEGWDEVAFLVALVDLSAPPWEIELIDDAFGGA